MKKSSLLINIHQGNTRGTLSGLSRFLLIPAGLLILTLTACGPQTVRDDQPGAAFPEIALAAEKKALGDLAGAAEATLQYAVQQQPGVNEHYRLLAIELFLQARMTERASMLLAEINPEQLDLDSDRTLLISLQAELALLNGNIALARKLLDSLDKAADLPNGRLGILRAKIYEHEGHRIEAARQRILTAPAITDEQQSQENQRHIWEALNGLTSDAVALLRTEPAPDPFSGWIELVLISKTSGLDRNRLEENLQRWRSSYPGHAADSYIVPQLLSLTEQILEQPRHIAVLLPMSGNLQEVGHAVRDGLLAARFQYPATDIKLSFYDSSQSVTVGQTYQLAQQSGADLIIGPLQKTAIAELARFDSLPIPVLALNTLTDTSPVPAQLYQFGLPPEEEAAQVAQHAIDEGMQRAVILTPSSNWGVRIRDAFSQHFTELGGEILSARPYRPEDNDYSSAIRHIMKLDQSRSRHRSLERLLGKALQFEPRRRTDVDMIFIAAFPRQARLITPQMKFHYAGDLPIYSTSHVYSGTPDPSADSDMNGIRFATTPWSLRLQDQELRTHMAALWPNRMERYSRFFALGIDTYRLAMNLNNLRNLPGYSLAGVTGKLSMDIQGYIKRQVSWAHILNGKAIPLAPQYGPTILNDSPSGLQTETEPPLLQE